MQPVDAAQAIKRILPASYVPVASVGRAERIQLRFLLAEFRMLLESLYKNVNHSLPPSPITLKCFKTSSKVDRNRTYVTRSWQRSAGVC